MAIAITINGTLTLDESQGLQTTLTTDDGNDVAISYDSATDTFSGSLAAGFLSFLNNDLTLNDTQGEFAEAVGAASSGSSFITVTKGAGETVSDLFFSDANGQALDGDLIAGMTTLAGDPLYLWSFGDTAIATTSNVNATSGRVVAAFYLNEAGDHLSAQVQFVTFEAIKHPTNPDPDDALDFTDVLNVSASGSLSFDFDNLESGNFLWVAVGSGQAGVLVTGQDLNVIDQGGKQGDVVKGGSTDPSDTVNTSQGGINATIGINSQHFTDTSGQGGTRVNGPTGVFTLVSGYVPLANAAQATGINVNEINYDNYLNSSSASLFISQTTGGGAAGAIMKIGLWEAGGGNSSDHAPGALTPEEGYSGANSYIGDQDTDSHLTDDTPVNVASVSITRGGSTFDWNSGNSGSTQSGITVTISANFITVSGVTTADTIAFTAVNDPANTVDGTFNRFTVQGLANTDAFDIGRIDLTQGISVSTDLGDSLLVDDDGLGLSGQNALEHVDEDNLTGAGGGDLSTGNIDNPADSDGIAGEQDEVNFSQSELRAILSSGTDVPGVFSLNLSVSGAVKTTGGVAVTSQGEAVNWFVSGGVIQGKTATSGDVVFTITVNNSGTPSDPTDDSFDFDLKGQLDHSNGAGELALLTVDLTPAFTAKDADNDPVDLNGADNLATPIRVEVENDTPLITAQIQDGLVEFATDSTGTVTKSLNGAVGADEDDANSLSAGTPGTKKYTITSFTEPTNVFPALDGVLSTDGTKVTYYSDGTHNTAVYELSLNQTANSGAGSYTFTVLAPPPGSSVNFDFTDLPSGQNLFGVIAADKTDLSKGGLLVLPNNVILDSNGVFSTGTPKSGTINTSKGGGPVTIGNGNQMFDSVGEGAWFISVDNPAAPSVAGVGLNQNNADDADTIKFNGTVEVTTASVEIVQAQGKGGVGMLISAYDLTTGNIDTDGESRALANDPTTFDDQVNIDGLRVYNASGTLIESWADANHDGSFTQLLDDATVDVIFHDDDPTAGFIHSAEVRDLGANFRIEFDTETLFDATLIENVQGKYDIGGFNISTTVEIPAQDFDFSVKITDYDNDAFGGASVPFANFSVTVDSVTV